MKGGIGYKLLYGCAYAVSLLPYSILYVVSDFFYLLVYHLVGYRKKVVRKNLSSSFPEKDQQELKKIEKAFYHWLCDYFVETLKLLSVSDETLLKHIEFRNAEEIEQCFDKGQSCAAFLGHYCNWELLSTTALAMPRWKETTNERQSAVMGLIYHPLRNKAFDRLFIQLRQKKQGTCIPKKEILRYLAKYRKEQRMSLFGYIADQNPKWENIHLWLPFLNHDTPVFTGAERIVRKMNNAVFYVDMERPERGKYICTFKRMSDAPGQLEEYELTRQFFQMLEETIRRAPQYYLWTHNRWKRTHEEFDRRKDEGGGRKDSLREGRS